MKKQDKNNMRTSMQKPIIDAEAFMKFFEETTGAKFVDAETGKSVITRKKYLALKAEKKAKEGKK